jgi:hypothetical protein
MNRLDGISHCIMSFPNQDYMTKVRWAVQQPYEYSVKLDEDIFVNSSLWDFLIENVDVLDNPKNAAMSSLLSNGIPTGDQFVREFFDWEDQVKINKIILKTPLPHIWGVDYSFLSKHTVGASHWDSQAFYESVRTLNHYYKGIHPVRVSLEAQELILELLLKPKYVQKFLDKQDYSLERSKLPYMCNSFFFVKTSKWKYLVENQELYRDGFEEVNLNLDFERNNLDWVFVKNGFGIHTKYNTRGEQDVEDNFYREFSREIIL